MPTLLKHSVSIVRANIAQILQLWQVQLAAWERLCTIPVHATAAGQKQTLERCGARASSKKASPASPADGDRHVEKLHGRWRDMYDASVLYEAVSETQPALASLVKSCSADFNNCLAAGRAADQSLVNIASTPFGQKGN